MTFWKISDTRMNCLITEAEITALGYSLEDLTQSKERTEEFLNLLLRKGIEVLGIQADSHVQGFYGAFLPDHSLMLSISCQSDNATLQEPLQATHSSEPGLILKSEENDQSTSSWQILFPSLDNAISFCNVFGTGQASKSRLYKDDNVYYLMVDFPNTDDGNQKAQRIISAGEFGGMVEKDAISEIYLNEHEKCILKQDAIETLCNM